jgi:hypothetical protein
MLRAADEFTCEVLAIRVVWQLNSLEVIDIMTDLLIPCGMPPYIRS